MLKLISIDPGKFKSGLVLVDIEKQIVDQAIVLKTEFIPKFLKTLKSVENISKIIIGNGTTSKDIVDKLKFFKKE